MSGDVRVTGWCGRCGVRVDMMLSDPPHRCPNEPRPAVKVQRPKFRVITKDGAAAE